ncbi:NAD-dependent DNA ligase LigA [Peptoniphilus raoultii]|uniref:NAD-dependent DNA ligase LigA n=1 Tax=Peptoniphilus raoultii TaxID=1776387 RepID=UPI000ABCBB06|nr:NAD-dependent DNA ligase LigA [Peptoniphilus raoultii]
MNEMKENKMENPLNNHEKMKDLVKKLNSYAYNYYTLDEPLVSDGEYDKLYDQLIEMEKRENYVLPDSPSQRVGGEVLKKFEKHKHIKPLYSMDKAQSLDQLKTWYQRQINFVRDYNQSHSDKLPDPEFIIELKFDGLTINLTYEGGYLSLATTRGNGSIGEIITEQVKTINEVPLSIDFKGKCEIQGEGLMPLSALKKYNESTSEKLKNARNAAAGALRNLDPKLTKSRHLTAYFYNVNYIEAAIFKNDIQMKDFLKKEGFLVSKMNYRAKSFEEIEKRIEEISEIRSDLNILIDGITIKISDFKTRELLGFTNKFPRWSIAFKFAAQEATTRLLEVVWNVGRSSKVTPSAILQPCQIGGVTIQRATLNNFDDINRKKLRLNSKVLIRRSNDVIPEILGTVPTEEKTYEIKKPEVCPACGTHLIQNGVHIFCPNTLSCKPQLVSRLVHFASRDAMNIEGLSEKTIETFMEKLDLKEIPDLYNLKASDIIKLEGFKEKRTQNLLTAIENSKNPYLANFIFALGIANVGIKTARDLANYFKNFDDFRIASFEELKDIGDIGPITAYEIIEFFKDSHIESSLAKLFDHGIKIKYDENSFEDSPLKDKVIVITGTLSRSRKEIEADLLQRGAKVTSSVSKNTDYVLAGESPGSKYDKAKNLGIEIISEDRLKELFGGNDE